MSDKKNSMLSGVSKQATSLSIWTREVAYLKAVDSLVQAVSSDVPADLDMFWPGKDVMALSLVSQR